MASVYPATSTLSQNASIASRWLLDEVSGNRADIVGSNTLTDNATVGAGTGYSDVGATFDNSADFELSNSEYLSHADNASLSPTGDMSFAFWLKVEQLPSTAGKHFAPMGKIKGADYSYSAYLSSANNKLIVSFRNSAGQETSFTTDAAAVVAGTWVHVGFSMDVSVPNIDIFLDGSEVASTAGSTLATSIKHSAAEFTLGAFRPSAAVDWFYDGLMQDAVFWNGVALTSAEVSRFYNLYTVAPGGGAGFLATLI